jgi:dTDP-4-dehydrorhamnose 3,5-epimerase
MQFIHTGIPEVIVIEPKVFSDRRGFIMEVYQSRLFSEAGIKVDFVQDNHSGSRQGTLRGLHYQIRHPQAKLVRVIAGEVFDVAADIRRSSPTFGQWVGEYLSAENKRQIFVPVGFAHGFYVLSDWAEVIYKASDFYSPEWERTLLWNDPQIGIEWPILVGQPPMLSQKDMLGARLDQVDLFD